MRRLSTGYSVSEYIRVDVKSITRYLRVGLFALEEKFKKRWMVEVPVGRGSARDFDGYANLEIWFKKRPGVEE